MNDLISVIIPTFNRSAFVREAVQSALDQDFPRVEVIVIDDGSTDDTREILSNYISSGRIIYEWQENAGRSEARNKGARISSGEYLLFLDSDDILFPGALTNLAKLADIHPKSSIFSGKVGFFSTGSSDVRYNTHFNYPKSFTDRQVINEAVMEIFLSIGAFIVKRDSFFQSKGFLKIFEPAEDLDFSIKLLHNNLYTWSSESVIVHKRKHEGNTDDTQLYTASTKICKHYLLLLKKGALPTINNNRQMISNFNELLFNNYIYLDKPVLGTKALARTIKYDFRKLFSYKRMKLFLYLWVVRNR